MVRNGLAGGSQEPGQPSSAAVGSDRLTASQDSGPSLRVSGGASGTETGPGGGSEAGTGPGPGTGPDAGSGAPLPTASAGGAAGLQELPRSPATRVAIPSAEVSAPLVPVGLDKDGWIQAPPADDPNLAGWYADAPSPGETGTSVIVGHVDTATGPAVFYRLGTLNTGQTIRVTRQDGRTVAFEVYKVRTFDKDRFPAAQVYGNTGRPELRVLTCGGPYSKTTGYRGNVVVFARMARQD
ncbi:class F sortase [Streptomyces sp. MST-110588]|uniref:class F sortase n=1 Tax=Streptomyces sp. MST-110588 TaxID=2833628 RepID=UPI001F5D5A6B|nr:class F sortase [Streptomyces sp. MST-110588]UNO43751.1 class F sortase [Streptomyces sp. MST-110588]